MVDFEELAGMARVRCDELAGGYNSADRPDISWKDVMIFLNGKPVTFRRGEEDHSDVF